MNDNGDNPLVNINEKNVDLTTETNPPGIKAPKISQNSSESGGYNLSKPSESGQFSKAPTPLTKPTGCFLMGEGGGGEEPCLRMWPNYPQK